MSPPRPQIDSSSSPSPKGIYADNVQISSACEQLRFVLGHLSAHIEDNLYLRDVNAKLNGKAVAPPPDYSGTNGREAAQREAINLLSEINEMTINDGDEKGLKENELLERLKKSFEKMDSLAAELVSENEDLRESNDCFDPNWVQQFEQAREQLEERKEGEEGEGGYQEDRYGDDTHFPPEEESEKTYKDLCSLQVRASDRLFCLLDDLDGAIQINQRFRKVNAKLKGDPSPPPPYDKYKGAEAAAEEAKQLLLESKSCVSRNDEQQDLNKLVQKLEKKAKEISSLTTNITKESEELETTNGLLEIYGVQNFEWRSDAKQVVTAPKSDPHDQDRNEDDLREKNRFLQAKLQAMEAAMRDAGKTTKATITPVVSSLGDITTSKELKNVRAGLVAANLGISQSMKAAAASSDHHLPCPFEPKLKNVRAALVAAIKKIDKLETARPASSRHLPYPIVPELKKKRKALVAANVRIGELEKQVAEEPTPHIPSRPSTTPLPPPKLKTITAGSSAELVAANERIVELEKQLAGAIAKATEASVGKSHSSPGPKPEENVESSSPTSGPATRLPLVSKAAVDPEATNNPPPLDTLYPTQLFIRRANLPSGSQHVKQQVKSIDLFKPPKHPSSAPSSSSSSSSPPNDPPPSSSAEPLYFFCSASEWLRWAIWFFVLFMMLVGVFLCWIEWAGLNRERSMWLSANEISRMEVEGEIAKAWRSWNRVGTELE